MKVGFGHFMKFLKVGRKAKREIGGIVIL